MSSQEEYAKAICELLLVWHSLKSTQWSPAKAALEFRINRLCEEGGFGK